MKTALRLSGWLVACLLVLSPARAQADGLPTSCSSFTDPTITAGSTVVKAVHISQLRTCVNDLRALWSLGAASWTDSTLQAGVTIVKSVHVTEIRTALNAVYTAGGASAPSYGSSPSAGGVILASHVTATRSAAVAAPLPPTGPSVTLTSDLASPRTAGTTITWTATPTGGTAPLSYKWWLSSDAGSTWSVLQDWTAGATTRTWTPVVPSTQYQVRVWVRNANNSVGDPPDASAGASYTISCSYSATPSSFNINGIAQLVQFSLATQAGCAWSAPVNPGGFLTRQTAASGTGSATISYAASTNGTGEPRSANIDVATVSVGVTQSGEIPPVELSLTADHSAPQISGTPIVWTAAASNGAPPYSYKFFLSTNGGRSWFVVRDWSTTATWTWVPVSRNANYRVAAWFRSVGNTTNTPEDYADVPFAITAAPDEILIDGPAEQDDAETQDIVVPITATDPLSQPVSFSAFGLPAGLAISASTGVISGRLTHDAAGLYSVDVRAASGARYSDHVIDWMVRCPVGDYNVAPLQQRAPDAGFNTLIVYVTAPATCPWWSRSEAPFITLPDDGPRLGSDEVQLELNNNPSGIPEAGAARVAGQRVIVLQPGDTGDSCTFTGPVRLDFNADGGTAQVTATPNNQNCIWLNVVTEDWVHLSGPSGGTGTASFNVTVDRNLGTSARTSYIAVNNHEFPVDQAAESGSSCTFSVSPSSFTVPNSESDPTRRIDVTTDSGCHWQASTVASFLDIYEVVYYNGFTHGSGHVRVRIENNPQQTTRNATVTVAGQSVSFEQLGDNPGTEPLPEPTDTEVRYYHTDAIGSVRLITNASGSQEARYDYMPFGIELGNTDDAPWNRVRFGGKESDPETQASGQQPLNYFGARYYQSQTGRFTGTDPFLDLEKALAAPQRWNRYVYALNNPLTFIDPDGRNPFLAMLQRFAERAASSPAAQRAQQAIANQGARTWVALTRLFNTHAGQEAIETVSELLTGADLGPGAGAARAGVGAVIGHYDAGYVKVGRDLGVDVFDIPKEMWDRLTPEQRTAANQVFLDGVIERGQAVKVVTNGPVRIPSTLAWEIDYFLGKGYNWNEAGDTLLPPSH